jgi:hypothetical protein
LKNEIEVGLGKIDMILSNLEISGLGQGVGLPVSQVKSIKGKEKIGDEKKGP